MDMDKWQTKFLWQMALYAVVLLALAAAAAAEAWFLWAKFLAQPQRMLVPTAAMGFAVVACIWAAGMCLSLIVGTRRQAARLKALQERRANDPASVVRAPLSPEQRAEVQARLMQTFRSLPPAARAQVEATLGKAAEKLRAERGSTPDVEAEIAEAQEVLRQAQTGVEGTAAPRSHDGSGWLMTLEPYRSLRAWLQARAEGGPEGPDKAAVFFMAVFRRITRATPAERGLRLIPILNTFLTLLACGAVLAAVSHSTFVPVAIVLSICVVGSWGIYFSRRRAARAGASSFLDITWETEWGFGIGLSYMLLSVFRIFSLPTWFRTHIHHPTRASILAVVIFGLCLALLLSWWFQVIREMMRPELGWGK